MIFDMDGTLVDSMPYWENLADSFLTRHGLSPVPAPIQQQIKTLTVTQSAELFVQHFGLQQTPQQTAQEMEQQMQAHYARDIPLKPGVRRYLAQLHAAGVQMCVASATAEPLVRLCLSRLGVAEYFSFFLSCETVGAGKNSPAVYFAATEKWGISPAQAAVYEDALYAAQTAKQAGFYVVGIYEKSAQTDWPALEELADETITDYEKIGG